MRFSSIIKLPFLVGFLAGFAVALKTGGLFARFSFDIQGSGIEIRIPREFPGGTDTAPFGGLSALNESLGFLNDRTQRPPYLVVDSKIGKWVPESDDRRRDAKSFSPMLGRLHARYKSRIWRLFSDDIFLKVGHRFPCAGDSGISFVIAKIMKISDYSPLARRASRSDINQRLELPRR